MLPDRAFDLPEQRYEVIGFKMYARRNDLVRHVGYPCPFLSGTGLVHLCKALPRGTDEHIHHFAEKFVIDEHPGPAGRMMLQLNEPTVPLPLGEVGEGMGQDMGMEVDLQYGHSID